jgi:hypothetical protein
MTGMGKEISRRRMIFLLFIFFLHKFCFLSPCFSQSRPHSKALVAKALVEAKQLTKPTQEEDENITWIIISDLDDTLIQSHMMNRLEMVGVFLSGRKVFHHLISLLQDLSSTTKLRRQKTMFYYVSKSYRFTYNGADWLRNNQLPFGKVYQRWRPFQSSYFFKRKTLSSILNKISLEKKRSRTQWRYLFLGDNSDEDIPVYEEAVKHAGIEKHSQIFIRDVRGETYKRLIGEETSLVHQGLTTLFQSESELLFHPWWRDVISEATVHSFQESARQKKLIPQYVLDTYKERLGHETCPKNKKRLSFCQEKIDRVFATYYDDYHKKFVDLKVTIKHFLATTNR